MSLYARLAALVLILAAVAAVWWKAEHMLAAADRAGYDRRAAEDHAAAEIQRETNRGTARKAEESHAKQAEVREEFLVITSREVHHEAAPLAACLVPEPVRLRIRAAAECALGDRSSGCGTDDAVPAAR